MKNDDQFSFDQILTASIRGSAYQVQNKQQTELVKKENNVIRTPDDSESRIKLSNKKEHATVRDFCENFRIDQSEICRHLLKNSARTYEDATFRKSLETEFEKLEGEFLAFCEIHNEKLLELKEIKTAYDSISKSKTFNEFEKHFEFFYRPFFWNNVISNSQFRQIIDSLKMEIVNFNKQKEMYQKEMSIKSEYAKSINEKISMIEEEILSSSIIIKDMKESFQKNNQKLNFLLDQKPPEFDFVLFFEEYQKLNIKQTQISLKIVKSKKQIKLISESIKRLQKDQDCITEIHFKQLFDCFQDEIIDLYLLKVENEFRMLPCIANDIEEGELIIAEFFFNFKKKIESDVVELLCLGSQLTTKAIEDFDIKVRANMFQNLLNWKSKMEFYYQESKKDFKETNQMIEELKFKHEKALTNQNLKMALKIKIQNCNFTERIDKFEKRFETIACQKSFLTSTRMDFLNFESYQSQLCHLKEKEELILLKVDDINKNFLIFCMNDLIKTNQNFQVVIFLLLIKTFNIDSILKINEDLAGWFLNNQNKTIKKEEKHLINSKKSLLSHKLNIFTSSFYYFSIYSQCPNIKNILLNIQSVDFSELTSFLKQIQSSFDQVNLKELSLLEIDEKNNEKSLFSSLKSDNSKRIKTILNKEFELTCPRSNVTVLKLFETIQPFLNGFKAFFRLSISGNSKKSSIKSKNSSNRDFQTLNQNNLDQFISSVFSEQKQRLDFNPFLAEKKTPLQCGYKGCYVFLSLESDELQFIIKTKNAKFDIAKKETFIKWSLPIAFFKYPLMTNNTKDFIDHINSNKQKDILDESLLFELSLSNIKFERVDLILQGFPLFCNCFSFFEIISKERKHFESLKRKIILKL